MITELISRFKCLFNKHEFGKMEFDAESPYKKCKHCHKVQKYKHKTLNELDNMTMNQIDEMLGGISNVDDVFKMIPPDDFVCSSCGNKLKKIEPEILLGGSKLMECTNCKERCYK
jgi:hypothetical protein